MPVKFFQTEAGNEPVREWLKSLLREEKKLIGEDIKTVQYGWPLGMPLVKKVDVGLWEIRVKLNRKIARVIITIHDQSIILLHGFIKKTQKISKEDLDLSKKRRKHLMDGGENEK